MLLPSLREEVLHANREIARRGLAPHTFGNVSGIDRSGDQPLVVIKPSGVDYESMTSADLVITDLEMPRMTGYELMTQLRQSPSTRRIPVMVVTSRAGAKHRDRAMKEGAAAFLTKPVQEDQLLAAVEQLIGTEAARPVVPVG